MLAGGHDCVVVGVVGLHDHASGQLAAACAARDLRHELEHALGGAKIRHRQRMAAADHAYQRDAVNVVAFGDNLRAYKQIDFARVKTGQEDDITVLTVRSVPACA
jgi:hypothetical protein